LTATDAPRRLIVSLHDVAPPWEKEVRSQLEALTAVGVTRLVLKVVPNWHGAYRLSDSRSMIELLQEAAGLGCQLVLHGNEHRPRGALIGSPVLRARAHIFATDAAEFMTLPDREALATVRSGLAEMRGAGLPEPDTFCAPGWLMPDRVKRLLPQAGIRTIVGMFTIAELEPSATVRTPAIGFMGAGAAQEYGIQALNRIVAMGSGRSRVVKIYLHPDPSGRGRWAPMVQQAQRLVQSGVVPSTIHDVLGDPG
jgi:hypothetical protein